MGFMLMQKRRNIEYENNINKKSFRIGQNDLNLVGLQGHQKH